ncbi:putative fatty acid beta hydroxylase [Stappia sp. 22II-S9-Z10]|nr:putative fatty acid beta hydroxylase [Stappia sp. 22II-S9-Z10]
MREEAAAMTSTATVPRLAGDHTLAFLRQGYTFISQHCDALATDRFRTRILLRPVLCARGSGAARMFYGGNHFTRTQGAMPPTVLRLLQDKGSVQQLDGSAHRHRKALFIDLLMNETATAEITEAFRDAWREAMAGWARRPFVVLLDEAYLILTRSVCRWMGLPENGRSDPAMARALSDMVEQAGSIGPAVLRALWRRRKVEHDIARLVTQIREGRADIAQDAPVRVIARHRDEAGTPLSVEDATVEILNVLRPVAAVARYVMFAALALHQHPQIAVTLAGAPRERRIAFAEEVRRLYPFFPLVGGKVKAPFTWDGHTFDAGDWVLLDLYGTNHDPRRFADPDVFMLDRAISWRDQGFDFIPHGGGDATTDHRCPGEQFTVSIMAEATRLLLDEMSYTVPPQDLTVALDKMPAKPESGLCIADVMPHRAAHHPSL